MDLEEHEKMYTLYNAYFELSITQVETIVLLMTL